MRKMLGALGLALLGSASAVPAQADLTQCVTNASAGGTGDAITIPLLPCALATNLLILTTKSPNTTTTPTLQMPGFPALPITDAKGSPIPVNALPGANGIVLLTSTGAQWRIVGTYAAGVGTTSVATEAALAALPGAGVLSALRTGYSVNGDTPTFAYTWSGSACSLGGGNGDAGAQVKPVGGGCWNAALPATIDIGLWGPVGSANDTALWQTADASLGALGLSKPVTCYASSNVANLQLTYISRLQNCDFNWAVSGGASAMVQYGGSAAFYGSNLTFTCPTYDPSALTYSAICSWPLLIEATTGVSIPQVQLNGFTTVGGVVGLAVYRSNDVQLSNGLTDRAWKSGMVISVQDDSTSYRTENVMLRNIQGRGDGQYCVSIPVNGPTAAFVAGSNFDAQGMNCYASGFLGPSQGGSLKECYDVAGNGFLHTRFQGVGQNCGLGGLEVKHTAWVSYPNPNVVKDLSVDFAYFANVDFGYGLDLAYETVGAADAPDEMAHIKAGVQTTWTAPGVWVGSQMYKLGDVVSVGGNVYLALKSGTSAGSGGPSCSGGGYTSQVTCTDGSVVWLWRETTRTVAANLAGARIWAVTDANVDLTAQGTAYGYILMPEGSSDATMRRVTLGFTGNPDKGCLIEAPISGSFTTDAVFDRVTLRDWDCHAGSNATAALRFGVLTGETSTWSGLVIDGGVFEAASGYGIYEFAGATVSGDILGAPMLNAALACVDLLGVWNGVWSGGGKCNVSSGGSTETPLEANGASAAGTFTIGEPIVVTSAVAIGDAAFAGWSNVGGAGVVWNVREMRGYAASIPVATSCQLGDFFLSNAPAAGAVEWYGTTAGTAGGCTWTAH